MTSDLTTRCAAEQRPPRLSQHQHLLHPSKTDEIEVLESGAIGEEHHDAKVCRNSKTSIISYILLVDTYNSVKYYANNHFLFYALFGLPAPVLLYFKWKQAGKVVVFWRHRFHSHPILFYSSFSKWKWRACKHMISILMQCYRQSVAH